MPLENLQVVRTLKFVLKIMREICIIFIELEMNGNLWPAVKGNNSNKFRI